MRAVAFDFVMESVVDGYLVVAMIINGVCKQLKSRTVPCAIVSTRVSPRCGNEEVGMYCLMQKRVDGVRARPILQ